MYVGLCKRPDFFKGQMNKRYEYEINPNTGFKIPVKRLRAKLNLEEFSENGGGSRQWVKAYKKLLSTLAIYKKLPDPSEKTEWFIQGYEEAISIFKNKAEKDV